ncbi:MAG: type II toxin-antitoxin system ParD family antitoxin, partial [Halothece sp.]
MKIELTPELEQIIQQQVDSGHYKSVDEVIYAGVKLLDQLEKTYQGRDEEIRQEVLQGIEASNRGEVIDSKVVFQNLQAKLNDKKV